MELLVGDRSSDSLYVWDMGPGSWTDSTLMPWPVFQHDMYHTGFYGTAALRPASPFSLMAEYMPDGEVQLRWELSLSESSRSDTPISFYTVYRSDSEGDWSMVVSVPAGEGSFMDAYPPGLERVSYMVTASDGLLESAPSNIATVSRELVSLATGCHVREVFTTASVLEQVNTGSAPIGTTVSSVPLNTPPNDVIEPIGNPRCLTDGSNEEQYRPSAGAVSVEIDLGRSCQVFSVLVERSSNMLIDGMDVTGIEAASEGGGFLPFEAGMTCRYLRVQDSEGATEIRVTGQSSGASRSAEIVSQRTSGGWSIPLGELSTEGGLAEISVYDVVGRLVWSSASNPGSDEVIWDGLTSSGAQTAAGLYLVRVESGGEVRTGRLVITR